MAASWVRAALAFGCVHGLPEALSRHQALQEAGLDIGDIERSFERFEAPKLNIKALLGQGGEAAVYKATVSGGLDVSAMTALGLTSESVLTLTERDYLTHVGRVLGDDEPLLPSARLLLVNGETYVHLAGAATLGQRLRSIGAGGISVNAERGKPLLWLVRLQTNTLEAVSYTHLTLPTILLV